MSTTELKKESAILESLGAAAIGHIGQNIITNARYLKPRKEYAQAFASGLIGREVGGAASALRSGAIKGSISPEFGIIQDKIRHAGEVTGSHLKIKHKLDVAGIMEKGKASFKDKRKLVTLRNLSRGKYLDAFDKNPELTKDVIDKSGHLFGMKLPQSLKNSAKQREIVSDLQDIHQKSKLMKTLGSIGDFKVDIPKGTSSGTAKVLRNSATIGASAVTGILEPGIGVMNAKKFFLTSPSVKKIPGAALVQKKLHHLVVTDPAKKAYNAGVSGKGISKLKDTVTRFGLNPVSAEINQVSNSVGKLQKKYSQ